MHQRQHSRGPPRAQVCRLASTPAASQGFHGLPTVANYTLTHNFCMLLLPVRYPWRLRSGRFAGVGPAVCIWVCQLFLLGAGHQLFSVPRTRNCSTAPHYQYIPVLEPTGQLHGIPLCRRSASVRVNCAHTHTHARTHAATCKQHFLAWGKQGDTLQTASLRFLIAVDCYRFRNRIGLGAVALPELWHREPVLGGQGNAAARWICCLSHQQARAFFRFQT